MEEEAVVLRIQRGWRRIASQRASRLLQHLRELCVCSVCHDECVRLLRCSSNHPLCVGCALLSSDPRCPLCREPRLPSSFVVDSTVPALLEAANVKLKCNTCGKMSDSRDCEHHRAWCRSHTFLCPCQACTHCATGSTLSQHVLTHQEVARVLPPHRIVCVVGRTMEALVLMVHDTTVVMKVSGHRRILHVNREFVPSAPQLQLAFRAYYTSPDAPPIRVTVRQKRVCDCEDDDEWLEEQRVGTIPPVMATRENVWVTTHMPSITPRSVLFEGGNRDDSAFFQPPYEGLQSQLHRMGLRDFPSVTSPFPMQMEPFLHAALLELRFEVDSRTRIGSVYKD
tara:strand:+ start:1344 stop:2360 length:1017 start_codon:yes stop_codon:yes gene_type:complete